MTTITFEMPTEQADALTRAADQRGQAVAELLRELADQFLSRGEAIDTAAKYVLEKNAELYRRLAK